MESRFFISCHAGTLYPVIADTLYTVIAGLTRNPLFIIISILIMPFRPRNYHFSLF